MDYSGNRFRRRFVGYDRNAVDLEFEKLLSQVDEEVDRNEQLKKEIDDLKEERRDWEYAKRTLEEERTAISRDRASLAESVSSISGKVADLENSLSSAKVANEALQNKVDATTSEKNQLQFRLETVQERNRELTLRERQFDEIEKSVSSIMSVTKRATDRLFQKSVENQENVIRIAGDAAQEAAMIRADLTAARDDMNLAFDEFQDKIDKIDASLTGAVHKLVAIKHDSGLKPRNAEATIEGEVERLLSMRAGEIDYSDGKGYAVPVLGPYSAKFIADTAKKVNAGEIEGNPPSQQVAAQKEPPYARQDNGEAQQDMKPTVKRSYPTNFESSDASIREANKLLDEADDAAEQKNYIPLLQQINQQLTPPPIPQPVYQPVYNPFIAQPYAPPVQYAPPVRQNPIGFGYHEEQPEQPELIEEQPEQTEQTDVPINPYSDGGYERVDISKLSSSAPTINMNTPDLQCIQPQQLPQNMFDASPVQISMNAAQPVAGVPNGAAYQYAGSVPTFTPNVPVVSAESQQPAAEQPAEEAPSAKRVEVVQKVRQVPVNEKVPVTVRHGR
ncbi:MAG: hypothetical protein IJM51_06670 [Clostridia bacterium]|nr:hypothetical protein [Clostridia bacterium]